jgi:hypothetical protein
MTALFAASERRVNDGHPHGDPPYLPAPRSMSHPSERAYFAPQFLAGTLQRFGLGQRVQASDH